MRFDKRGLKVISALNFIVIKSYEVMIRDPITIRENLYQLSIINDARDFSRTPKNSCPKFSDAKHN